MMEFLKEPPKQSRSVVNGEIQPTKTKKPSRSGFERMRTGHVQAAKLDLTHGEFFAHRKSLQLLGVCRIYQKDVLGTTGQF